MKTMHFGSGRGYLQASLGGTDFGGGVSAVDRPQVVAMGEVGRLRPRGDRGIAQVLDMVGHEDEGMAAPGRTIGINGADPARCSGGQCGCSAGIDVSFAVTGPARRLWGRGRWRLFRGASGTTPVRSYARCAIPNLRDIQNAV